MRIAATLVVLACCAGLAGARDFEATEADFRCLLEGAQVRNMRVFHRKPKQLKKAVRTLEKAKPGRRVPVGTIVQLVPFEAMVKRAKRWGPETNGWEFFQLRPSATGTTIVSRGADAVNFLGGSCVTCHQAARRFDFVCEKTHGCVVLPLDDSDIAELQASDPRCRP